MKLLNYKCTHCDTETEILQSVSDPIEDEIQCKCGAKAVKWNFKQNNQNWKYNDRYTVREK